MPTPRSRAAGSSTRTPPRPNRWRATARLARSGALDAALRALVLAVLPISLAACAGTPRIFHLPPQVATPALAAAVEDRSVLFVYAIDLPMNFAVSIDDDRVAMLRPPSDCIRVVVEPSEHEISGVFLRDFEDVEISSFTVSPADLPPLHHRIHEDPGTIHWFRVEYDAHREQFGNTTRTAPRVRIEARSQFDALPEATGCRDV